MISQLSVWGVLGGQGPPSVWGLFFADPGKDLFLMGPWAMADLLFMGPWAMVNLLQPGSLFMVSFVFFGTTGDRLCGDNPLSS